MFSFCNGIHLANGFQRDGHNNSSFDRMKHSRQSRDKKKKTEKLINRARHTNRDNNLENENLDEKEKSGVGRCCFCNRRDERVRHLAYRTDLMRCKDCDEYLKDEIESEHEMIRDNLDLPFDVLYSARFLELPCAVETAHCRECDCSGQTFGELREWRLESTTVILCLICWLKCNKPIYEEIHAAERKVWGFTRHSTPNTRLANFCNPT